MFVPLRRIGGKGGQPGMAVPPATLLGSGRDFLPPASAIQFRAASDWFVVTRS